MKQKLRGILRQAVKEIIDIFPDREEIEINIPKKREFGDFSSNIAMKLGNKGDIGAHELGDKIKNRLMGKYDFIEDIKVMGPGFINFYLKKGSFTRESLKSIENGDFKELQIKKKAVRLSTVLRELKDIFNLYDFRAFVNMYYLGNLCSFAGYEVEKIVLVEDYKDDINIKYLLSNFKNIKITSDKEELRESITFCSPSNQGLFKDMDYQRFIAENVNICRNGIEVYNPTLNTLLEQLGLDRVKYTLCNKALNKEASIELTRNDLIYIQYPYSRISSIINIFKDEGIDIDNIEDFKEKDLSEPLEQEIIKKMLSFKAVIMDSINQNQPYKFIKYFNELCELFYKINDSTLYRQLNSEKLAALLKLLNNVKIVMKEILTILELPIYEKM